MSNKKRLLWYLLIAVLLYMAIANMVQKFSCPEMTETQLFLHFWETITLDLKHC